MLKLALDSLLKNVSKSEGRLFTVAVRQRDIEGLRNIIRFRFPNVAWGKYYKKLSETDQSWLATTVLRLN